MRWFTDAAYESEDDEEWDRMLADYNSYLDSIVTRLPPDFAALATDPRFSLHDAHIREVRVDRDARSIEIVVVAGDLQVGYRRLTLRFLDAALVPDNLQSVEFAVGAEYHTEEGSSWTVILAHEAELLQDGRFLLRLRLWPFYEFGIEFGSFSMGEASAEGPDALGPGRFIG